MKYSLSYVVGSEGYKNSVMLEGLAYLYRNFKSSGSHRRDTDAIQGIGIVLEQIAQDVRRISHLAESSERYSDLEVEVDWEKSDPIGQALSQLNVHIESNKTKGVRHGQD